jgi:hypothetical protein
MTFEELCDSKQDQPPTLRLYKLEDIPMLCALVAKYVPELPNYDGITVDKDRVAYILRQHVQNSQSFACWLLVNSADQPVGGIAAQITPSFLTNDKISNDNFLFVLPGWRNLKNANILVSTYKQWSIAMGCILTKGSCMGGYEPDAMDIFMKRNGFKPMGALYAIRNDNTYLLKQLNALKGK